ncbi:MAG: c-type cytochrome [Paracoccaceae bacterium]
MLRRTLALTLPLALAAALPAQAAGILPWTDAGAVAEGEVLYQDFCASCHGADLEGEPDWRTPKPSGRMPAPPHDETGHTWHHPDRQLFELTKQGVAAVVGRGYESDMMGFGDVLSDDEILAVLAYIKSTWPARVIETHDRINAAQEGN